MNYLALYHRSLEDKTVSRPPNVFFLRFSCSVLSDSFVTPWTRALDRVSQERMLEWVSIIQLQYQRLKHIVPSKKVKVTFYLYVK